MKTKIIDENEIKVILDEKFVVPRPELEEFGDRLMALINEFRI